VAPARQTLQGRRFDRVVGWGSRVEYPPVEWMIIIFPSKNGYFNGKNGKNLKMAQSKWLIYPLGMIFHS